MPKRFYLATRKDRETIANEISERLTSRGWERTFVWSGQDVDSDQKRSEVARLELDAIRNADVLIVLLPGGLGTHVEIGAALAWGKAVILHSPDLKTLESPYPCVFHYHPGITRIISETVDVDSLLACLPNSD